MFRTQLVRLGTVAASTALLAVMLLGVGGAVAKTPGWQFIDGFTSGVVCQPKSSLPCDQPTFTTSPTKVSPNAYAAFSVTIKNTGTSNISALYLSTDISSTNPAGNPVAIFQPSSNPCRTDPSLPLFCSFSALNSGASVNVEIVFRAPASSLNFNFLATGNGNTPSDGTKSTSHGDTLLGPAAFVVDGTANFSGGFVLTDGTVFQTGSGDVQQTTVHAPGVNIPVTISESTGTSTSQCGSGTPVGQLVGLNVNNGHLYSSAFLTTLKITASSLPGELVLSQVAVCHIYTDASGNVTGSKLFTYQSDLCNSDTAPTNAPCIYPKWSGTSSAHDKDKSGDADDADNHTFLVIDLFDVHNGSLRGQYG